MDGVVWKNLATFCRKQESPANASPGHKPQDPQCVASGPCCNEENKHPSCSSASWHPPGSRIKSNRWQRKSCYRNKTKKLLYFFLKLIRFPETITKWSGVPRGADAFPSGGAQGQHCKEITSTAGSSGHRGHAPATALAGHQQS